MMYNVHRGSGAIFASFVVAFILTILPLPGWTDVLRPEWVALVLIYWCMAIPQRIGVGVAWITGLFLDVIRGGLLGQQALSLCLIAYITLKLYQRIRVAPLWQQAFSILILMVLHQLVVLWIKGIIGQSPQSWTYWLPSITSMALWPVVFSGMREYRRRYRIS